MLASGSSLPCAHTTECFSICCPRGKVSSPPFGGLPCRVDVCLELRFPGPRPQVVPVSAVRPEVSVAQGVAAGGSPRLQAAM